MSGVGRGMGVLDGVHVPQGEGEVLGVFIPIGLNGIFFTEIIRLMRENLTIFLYGQYIVENICSLVFGRNSHVRDRSLVSEKFAKM